LLYCRLLPSLVHILNILCRLWYVCDRVFSIEVVLIGFYFSFELVNLNIPLIVHVLFLAHAFIHAIYNNGVYLLHSWVVGFGVRVDLFILGIPAGHRKGNWESCLLLGYQFPIPSPVCHRINQVPRVKLLAFIHVLLVEVCHQVILVVLYKQRTLIVRLLCLSLIVQWWFNYSFICRELVTGIPLFRARLIPLNRNIILEICLVLEDCIARSILGKVLVSWR
jgi:hypothetical protein